MASIHDCPRCNQIGVDHIHHSTYLGHSIDYGQGSERGAKKHYHSGDMEAPTLTRIKDLIDRTNERLDTIATNITRKGRSDRHA